jgi:flagellar assembly protein FliH
MSCKVLSGPAAPPVESLVWPPVGRGAGRGGSAPVGALEAELARAQARLRELERQAREREQQAYQSGLAAGRAQGAEEAAAQFKPVLERMGRAVDEILEQRRRFRREAEEDVVRLAVAIARRVLHRELSLDPEALLGVVKAALHKLEAREASRLRVHPADAAMVREYFEQADRGERIEIQADAKLERGAVLFDTVRGSLDASVETQLAEIQRGLTDLIHGGR